MGLRPLGDRVLVRRVEEENKTKSGIIIPDGNMEKPLTGKIVAIGPGKRHESGKVFPIPDIKIGDIVLFGKYSGIEVKINDETLLLMNSDDLLGIMEEE
ncbi:MAG: co-chaperone GroES [Halobacteriovoraceae bacterium]|nr:co-chaperone GroES [Halobacteriovoraceae bacterium]